VSSLSFDLPRVFIFSDTLPFLSVSIISNGNAATWGAAAVTTKTVQDSLGGELFQRAIILRTIFLVCHLILLLFHPALISGMRQNRQWRQGRYVTLATVVVGMEYHGEMI